MRIITAMAIFDQTHIGYRDNYKDVRVKSLKNLRNRRSGLFFSSYDEYRSYTKSDRSFLNEMLRPYIQDRWDARKLERRMRDELPEPVEPTHKRTRL